VVDRARIVITSPSFNETLPGPSVTTGREAYLAHLLLKQADYPMPPLHLEYFDVTVAPRTFGQKSLSCTTLAAKATHEPSDEYCTDPETAALRLIMLEGICSHALNDLSTFANTQLAMTHTIAYWGHKAIQGHIDSIEPFDPDHSSLELGPLAPSHQGVTSPRLLTRIQPVYPEGARKSGLSGFTVLHFRILANGRVSPIDIIASSGYTFTDVSTDAVRRWGYTPMKRNGSPTECDSTLMITFSPPGKNLEGFNVLMNEYTASE
jgi:TonB family protein